MASHPQRKVGIISCSGEGCPEGTISRIAARLVLERLPRSTVTICLPLFLAGGKEERAFAKEYATITVDGCQKACAKIGTERHSGRVASSIVVTQLTKNRECSSLHPRRKLSEEDLALAQVVAEKVAQEVDNILKLGR